MMRRRILISLCTLFFSFPLFVFASERGDTGMTITMDAEGMFWNPIVKSLTVAKVSPKSPADLAGIVVGDELIEIGGKTVVGSRGKELMPLMQKNIGESVQIKIKHSNNETLVVNLTFAAKNRQ